LNSCCHLPLGPPASSLGRELSRTGCSWKKDPQEPVARLLAGQGAAPLGTPAPHRKLLPPQSQKERGIWTSTPASLLLWVLRCQASGQPGLKTCWPPVATPVHHQDLAAGSPPTPASWRRTLWPGPGKLRICLGQYKLRSAPSAPRASSPGSPGRC
jgi:hypothetical protein